MDIKTGKLCKIGGRQKNDDTAEIVLGNGAVRVYVGDGLGSYAGGKQASETAGQALLTFPGSMLGDEELRGAAKLANEAVYALQKSTNGTMKTTIVFLTIENHVARWMHVGDSRLYHFVNGKLVSQTVDHSVSQMAVMMGEITTHQIRFHEDRNRVLRSLGGENAKPELSKPMDISEGSHAFLLCTDGFWEYVYEDEMEQTLAQATDPDDWIARMEQILLSRVTGNNDNYSASVVFTTAGSRRRRQVKKEKKKGKGLLLTLALLLAVGTAAAMLLLPVCKGQEAVEETTVLTTTIVEETEDTESSDITKADEDKLEEGRGDVLATLDTNVPLELDRVEIE